MFVIVDGGTERCATLLGMSGFKLSRRLKSLYALDTFDSWIVFMNVDKDSGHVRGSPLKAFTSILGTFVEIGFCTFHFVSERMT